MKKITLLLFISNLLLNQFLLGQEFGTLKYNTSTPTYYGNPTTTIESTNDYLINQHKINKNRFISFYNIQYDKLDNNKESLEYKSRAYALDNYYKTFEKIDEENKWAFAKPAIEAAFKKYYRDIIEYEEKVNEIENEIKLLLGNAKKEFNNNNYNEAILIYNSILDYDSENIDALYGRIFCYNYLGEIDEVIMALNYLIVDYPSKPYNYKYRGIMYFEKGLNELSLKDINYAMILDQYDIELFYIRANIYVEINSFSNALSDFNKYIENNSNNPKAYLLRGNVKAELKDENSAIKDYQKAIELNPNYSMAYNNL